MDPLTAFVTIVQLIALFKQESSEQESKSKDEFLRWLDNHHLDEIKRLITETFHLTDQVNQVLLADQKVILAKIHENNLLTAATLAQLREFSGMAKILAPQATLSEQAREVLRRFYDSGGAVISYLPGSNVLQIFPGNIPLRVMDARFLADDLHLLASMGLLSEERQDQWFSYAATRAGSEFATKLKQNGT
jgi:hypothetical protein